MSRDLILALHAGHNAAAVIGDSRGITLAIQEERLTLEKNYWGFPKQAVRQCLATAGASPRDVAVIAYGGNQVISRYHTRDDILAAYRRQGTVLGKLRQRVAMPLVLAAFPNYGRNNLIDSLREVGMEHVPVSYHDHHLTHAVTAYYGLRRSPEEKYLVVTCDGAGDNMCASVWVMGGGERREISRTHWDNSLGAIYSWVTYAMGFVPLEHEYKLMGMAPYASERAQEESADIFRQFLGLSDDGLGFQKKTDKRTNDLGEEIFDELRGRRFDYVCAGLQRFTEELLTRWVAAAVQKTGVKKVLAAGGVFMNVKANKRIAELAEVESFQAFPSCGDETLPFGTYWAEAAARFGEASVRPLDHFYLGDDLDPDATKLAVERSGFAYEKPASMPDAVADILVAGKPLARCAGRMEFGARALGNRSILADPKNSDVVRVINQMVKKRDFWMPFAPMMKVERQDDYLHNPKHLESPFMMMTFDTKDNFRDLIAAVHNADLTCRAQLLSRAQNEEMHDIISAFEARTGRAVVLNTSFNLHGYPIVRTAQEALDVLKGSGLQHLQVGPYLVHKPAS
jgi:carbamoyltransferase